LVVTLLIGIAVGFGIMGYAAFGLAGAGLAVVLIFGAALWLLAIAVDRMD